MDVITYALLKQYINSTTSDFVTNAEMISAISSATEGLIDETDLQNAIITALSAITAGFDYKGSVATIDALPSSGNTKGDCYTVSENLGTYVWDGTDWFEYNINLDLILQEGTEETAQYHLGFYLDENGDLNQVDE